MNYLWLDLSWFKAFLISKKSFMPIISINLSMERHPKFILQLLHIWLNSLDFYTKSNRSCVPHEKKNHKTYPYFKYCIFNVNNNNRIIFVFLFFYFTATGKPHWWYEHNWAYACTQSLVSSAEENHVEKWIKKGTSQFV